jgi:hypothetical protein
VLIPAGLGNLSNNERVVGGVANMHRRPAGPRLRLSGGCDLMARMWLVGGVIGENGRLTFDAWQ